MIDSNLIKELTDKFFKNFDSSSSDNINNFREDVASTFKLVLEQTFSNLDLVTKQEFDTQNQVLAKARLKLEELDNKIAELSGK